MTLLVITVIAVLILGFVAAAVIAWCWLMSAFDPHAGDELDSTSGFSSKKEAKSEY